MVILQKHIDFLIDRHAWFAALDDKPEDFGELFSIEWTRSVMSSVVSKGAGHLTEVCIHHCNIRLVSDCWIEPHALGSPAELGTRAVGSSTSIRKVNTANLDLSRSVLIL
jgi:hypothetical protein